MLSQYLFRFIRREIFNRFLLTKFKAERTKLLWTARKEVKSKPDMGFFWTVVFRVLVLVAKRNRIFLKPLSRVDLFDTRPKLDIFEYMKAANNGNFAFAYFKPYSTCPCETNIAILTTKSTVSNLYFQQNLDFLNNEQASTTTLFLCRHLRTKIID